MTTVIYIFVCLQIHETNYFTFCTIVFIACRKSFETGFSGEDKYILPQGLINK